VEPLADVAFLEDAFVLVGFRKRACFYPDLTKPACIYIGWLITSCVIDSFRGTSGITYPYYEWHAIKELQKYLDGSSSKQLHEVVYPVVIMGLFEVSPLCHTAC
jgi:hypothetical protein